MPIIATHRIGSETNRILLVLTLLATILTVPVFLKSLFNFGSSLLYLLVTSALAVWISLGVLELIFTLWLNAGIRRLNSYQGSFDEEYEDIKELLDTTSHMVSSEPKNLDSVYARTSVLIMDILHLATRITDNPRHGLTSNYMHYFPDTKMLFIIGAVGPYSSLRLSRGFSPYSDKKSGSCGISFKENVVKIIPNALTSGEIYWLYAQEKLILKGVINIPISVDGSAVGVLNIDSPTSKVLGSEKCRKRIPMLKELFEEVILLRKSLSVVLKNEPA